MTLKNPRDPNAKTQARAEIDRIARQAARQIQQYAATGAEAARSAIDEALGHIAEFHSANPPEERKPASERRAKGGRNRMEKGGEDRSDEDSQEELPTE